MNTVTLDRRVEITRGNRAGYIGTVIAVHTNTSLVSVKLDDGPAVTTYASFVRETTR